MRLASKPQLVLTSVRRRRGPYGALPSFGQNLLGGVRMRRPGGHLYCGPKPIVPEPTCACAILPLLSFSK